MQQLLCAIKILSIMEFWKCPPCYALVLLILLLGTGYLPVCRLAIVGRCFKNEEGSRCTASNSNWQQDGVCITDKLKKPACHVANTRQFSFIIVAAIAQLGTKTHISNLWIKGAGPGLSWERSTKMRIVKDGYWDLNIEYTYDSNSLLCSNELWCSLNQKALEFRFYRDELGTDGMLGPNFYLHLPVSDSISGYPDFSPPPVYFFPLFDSRKVDVKELSFENPLHFKRENQNVSVTLFYPPSYKQNVHKRYPVVIVFGDNLKYQLVPLLESMYTHEANIEEAFIVAVHNSGPPPYCTYNPFSVIESDPSIYGGNKVWECVTKACQDCMTCYDTRRVEFCDAREFSLKAKRCNNRPRRCSNSAGALLDTIENIILPALSIRTLSRMLIDYPKERISVIGIDGGGLLACFAALTRPLLYKNAACISAPFHWPLRSIDRRESRERQGIGFLLDEVTNRIEVRKELLALYTTQKYYIDVGLDDNKYLPIVDAYNYSDWVVAELEQRLKLNPANLLYFRDVLGGENSEVFLRQTGDYRMLDRIKVPLLFFLKPEGGYSEGYTRSPNITGKQYLERWTSIDKAYNISKHGIQRLDEDSLPNCDEYRVKKPYVVSIPVYLVCLGEWLSIKVSSPSPSIMICEHSMG